MAQKNIVVDFPLFYFVRLKFEFSRNKMSEDSHDVDSLQTRNVVLNAMKTSILEIVSIVPQKDLVDSLCARELTYNGVS